MQGVCVAFILLAACWFDIRQSKIPNGLILTGWAISLALAAWQQGGKGLAYSVAGILAALVMGFPLYWCRAVGAGDIKLLSVLAGIDGLQCAVQVFAAGIPLAAAAGVFVLAGSAFGFGKEGVGRWRGRQCGGKEGVSQWRGKLCAGKEEASQWRGRQCVGKEEAAHWRGRLCVGKEGVSQWRGWLCEGKREGERGRMGGHRLILAPFLALAYFILLFWGR